MPVSQIHTLEYLDARTITPGRYSRPLHVLAFLTVVAIFPLIFLGGLVTSHGAGMSVPDWPNSYGYNMFLFPPSRWVGNVFYEHTHRLMGTLVGLLSLSTTVFAWCVEKRSWVKWVATSVLAGVIVQGILGGLRVTLAQLNLAIIHGCIAQAVFCLAAYLSIITSFWWYQTTMPAPHSAPTSPQKYMPSLSKLGMCVIALICVQLVIGALMRHNQAGLAIPDFPLNYGNVLPPTNFSQLNQVNIERANGNFGRSAPELFAPVTLTQIWLHFTHRLWALVVCIFVLIFTFRTLRRYGRHLLLRDPLAAIAIPAAILPALLVTQLTLGILTVILRKPADIASWHVGIGALTLLTAFVLTVRAKHLLL